MTTDIEDQIKTKLETIKESIIGHKFVVDNLLDRSDKIEIEMRSYQSQLQELRNNTVRTDERIASIQRYLDGMSHDIRTVRNSVVGAVIVAIVIGVSGVAVSTFSRTNTAVIHTQSAPSK